MITFSSNPQMVSDKLPEIFSAFNRPVISQKQVPQKDKDTDVAVLNKKDNNIDADTQHTKPIISQPKKKLGFWKNLGAATVGYFGMKIPANISVKVLNKGFLNKMIEVSSDLSTEDKKAIEDAAIKVVQETGLGKKGVTLQIGDSVVKLRGDKPIITLDRITRRSNRIAKASEPIDILSEFSTKILSKTTDTIDDELSDDFFKAIKGIEQRDLGKIPQINFPKPESLKRRLKKSLVTIDDVTTAKIKELLKKNPNACFSPFQNKIYMPKDNKLAPAVFHEIGHAMDHNKGIFLRGVNYLRHGITITKLPLVLLAVALFKHKKAEGEKPVGAWDKATTFIKENIGKLLFASMLPMYINEIMASVHGNRLASKHLSPELLKKVNLTNRYSKLSYTVVLLVTTLMGMLAVKIKDKIAQPDIK